MLRAMPDKHLLDRTTLWVAVAAVLAVIGGIPLGLAALDGLTHLNFTDGRFLLGLLFEVLAFLALRWATILRRAPTEPAAKPSDEPTSTSSPGNSPQQTRRQQQMEEFQSKGRALVASGEDLEEQLRAIPEDAPRETAERWTSLVANYDSRVSAFFIRWGETNRYGGIASVVGGRQDRDAATAAMPGPAWRRSLVERVLIARSRVRRRMESAG
jgi:hypothetical protein